MSAEILGVNTSFFFGCPECPVKTQATFAYDSRASTGGRLDVDLGSVACPARIDTEFVGVPSEGTSTPISIAFNNGNCRAVEHTEDTPGTLGVEAGKCPFTKDIEVYLTRLEEVAAGLERPPETGSPGQPGAGGGN